MIIEQSMTDEKSDDFKNRSNDQVDYQKVLGVSKILKVSGEMRFER